MLIHAILAIDMSFPDRFGSLIVANEPGRPLLDHPGAIADLIAELRDRGALLLRGFAWDLEALQAFAARLAPDSLRYGGDRERLSSDDTIQRAERGQMAISLHSELAFTPYRPDTALFACRRPAASGGRTLIGDGRRVWELLSPSTRARFEACRVCYHRRFPPSAWRRLFGIDDDFELLHERLASLPDFSYEIHETGILDTIYTTSAVAEDTGGEIAFCNNVSNMVEAEGIPGSGVDFEDGGLVEGALRTELYYLLKLEAQPIDWRAGDVLILDNRRVMHGREAFEDPDRDIWVRFANLA